MPGRTLDASVVRSIASWAGDGAVTSLYLDVDGQRHPRWADVERRLDHLLRDARRKRVDVEVAGGGAEADLAAIRTWLDRELDRSATRGVALFSAATRGRFEAVGLPAPVRDQVVVDRDPDVAQLCLALAGSWPVVAVVVDGQRWRVVRSEQDGAVGELDVVDDVMPRNVDVDIELAGFERHEEELAREHHRHVARRLTAELDRRPARYLVLFGPRESLAGLAAYLPDRVVALIAGREATAREAGADAIARAAREAAGHADRLRQSATVATLRQRAVTGTLAATGLGPTLQAIAAGHVTTLLVERTLEGSGGRCEACRLLVTGGGPCPRCGGRVRAVENVVDAAVADAYLHGASLEALEDGAMPDLGRIGVLLPHRDRGGVAEPGDA